jgi:quercetin dioxygenase-like cupin family protein
MFISHIDRILRKQISLEEAKGVIKQTAIGPEQGWAGHVMRVFTLLNRGFTPQHSHPWPHINYVLKGKGILFHEGEETPLEPGSIAYLPANTLHQFRSSTDDEFSFICIVPEEGDK